MQDLLQNFNKGLDSYLSKDQLKEICPVAFKDAPTNPKVTDKYLFVNTETIVDDLATLGWIPVSAAMRKNRGKDTIFSKHMVSFQNPDIKITSEDGDNAYPRIIMTNSHDGLQAFKYFPKIISNISCSFRLQYIYQSLFVIYKLISFI